MDDKAMTERCEAARDPSATMIRPSQAPKKHLGEKAFGNMRHCRGEVSQSHRSRLKETTFNAGTLNLFAGSCDQTRGFSFKGRTSISRHAVQNSACVFAESDYLKLQITNTRYQCSLGRGVDDDVRQGRPLI
jgi:hypothetical protein